MPSLSYLFDAGADPEISAELLGLAHLSLAWEAERKPNSMGPSAWKLNIKAMGAQPCLLPSMLKVSYKFKQLTKAPFPILLKQLTSAFAAPHYAACAKRLTVSVQTESSKPGNRQPLLAILYDTTQTDLKMKL